MNFLIVAMLFAIVASLGHALYSMASGPANSERMVKALTTRIALSVALFALLFAAWGLGLIEPHAVHR
jgi:multisubunit Na+/H+ antiporter MnhF subunit